MKKLFLGLLAFGTFQLTQAQTQHKATPTPPVAQNEKGLEAVEPPPPPLPPIAAVAPPPPPPPPPPIPPKVPVKKKTTFAPPVIVKDEKE